MKRVYFAGKVSSNGWRQSIVDLRNEIHHQLGSPYELMCDYERITKPGLRTEHNFVYGGPFLFSCDHGCYHGDTSHGMGAGNDYYSLCSDCGTKRSDVFNWCITSINQSDIIFCYLEDVTAYGTVFELGYAYSRKVPIYIYLSPRLKLEDIQELWFSLEGAKVVKKVNKIEDALQDFKQRLIADKQNKCVKPKRAYKEDLATQPQIDFIQGLLANRGLTLNEASSLSKKSASQFIDVLKNQEDLTIFKEHIKSLKPSSLVKTTTGEIGVVLEECENFDYFVKLESGEELVLSSNKVTPFHPQNRKEHSVAYQIINATDRYPTYKHWVELFNDVQYDKEKYMEFNSVKGYTVPTFVKTKKGIVNLANPDRKYRKCWSFEHFTMYTIKAEDSYNEDQMLRFMTLENDERVFYIGTDVSSMQKIKELEKKTICSIESMKNFSEVIELKHIEGWDEVKDVAEKFDATFEEQLPAQTLIWQHDIPLTLNKQYYLKSLYLVTLQILVTLNGSFVNNKKTYDFSSICGKTSEKIDECIYNLKEFNSVCRRYRILTTPIDFDSSGWCFQLSSKGAETIFERSNVARIERAAEVFPDLLQFDLKKIKQKYMTVIQKGEL